MNLQSQVTKIPNIYKEGTVIDSLLGTGLTREAKLNQIAETEQ